MQKGKKNEEACYKLKWHIKQKISEHKTQARPVCINCSKPHKQSTKFEVKKYNGRNSYRRIKFLQIEVTYKAEIINTAKYVNTKYKHGQFVILFKAAQAINQIWSQKVQRQQRLQKN
jgi:hypothetical protein